MRILIASPRRDEATSGNQVTAQRWASLFESLGHQARIIGSFEGQPGDVLVVLHALKSHSSLVEFRRNRSRRPLILALTGTDLYRDLKRDPRTETSLGLADRLVALQAKALEDIPQPYRSKTRVIYQSASAAAGPVAKAEGFRIAVIGHLRPVKDSLRTAHAVRDLPPKSRIEVIHIGRALDEDTGAAARREDARNPRYEWRGEVSHEGALRVLASSHLLSLTSLMEGGANALSEALAADVPVAASRIPGLIGTLGEDYPGFFPPGNTAALRQLLLRAEADSLFYDELSRHCRRAAPLVEPAREREDWRALLEEVTGRSTDAG